MEKKNLYTFIISFVGLIVIGFALGKLLFNQNNKQNTFFGASQQTSANTLNAPFRFTASVTTTNNGLPVQVLTRNMNRAYALVMNDSDTVIYLFLQNFDSASDAAASTTPNKGIRLNANGGAYEIVPPDNLYTGDIWATSTASGKVILVTEK